MNFTKIVEAKIQEAIKRGEFENLPNRGKPIDLDAYFQTPPHLRMAYHVLKNSGVLPQEVALMQEISELQKECQQTHDPDALKQLIRRINEKSAELSIILERYRRRK